MTSALGSITTPPPQMEPGICIHCGIITDIVRGVVSVCGLHEEKSPIMNVPHIFQVLGQALPQKQVPEVMAIWGQYLQRMRELQAHLLSKDQVATAGPPKH